MSTDIGLTQDPDMADAVAEEATRINAHHGMTSSNGQPVAPVAQPSVEQHSGQLRMAYRLATAYDRQLMFVHGVGWHWWDGRRWAEDDQGRAKRAVLDVLTKALADSLGDRQLRADVKKCESSAGVNGVLDIGAALPQFAHTVRDLDPDPYLLNVANGTLDLRTMGMLDHNPTDRITKVTVAAWDPAAHGDGWDAFLSRVLPDAEVRAFMQRYVGVGLAGTVLEHVLAILTGTGRNGKGVFYGAVNHALGDYAGTAEPDLFMHRNGAHPTGEMDLRGMRWVVVSESDKGQRLAEATVKRLTGGDMIKARRMRQDFITFAPSHTPALVTNHLPRVSGDDPALWARLRVVPFDVVIPKEEQDPHLPDKLQAEADAVLAWAVEGWRQYQEVRLSEPDAVVKATADYCADADAIGRFLAAECLINPHAHVTVGELWDRWQSWRADDGAEEISKKAFGTEFDKRGFQARRGTGGLRVRRGSGLLAEQESQL